MKKISIILFSVVLFASCNNLKDKLEGTWAIDQAYYNDEPVMWDLIGNALGLEKNNSCDLPIINISDRHTEKERGTWKVYKENKKSYIQINTTNRIFNRTFEIQNLRKVQDTVSWGYLMKMTLTADSLKLDCTKPLYE